MTTPDKPNGYSDDSYGDTYPDGPYSYGYYSHGVGDNYSAYEYAEYAEYKDTFFYKSYDFEKVIYLYVWALLISLTTIANVLVILVLTRRRMRNATNVILVAIAITDTLTGMVTLPPYIYAYTRYYSPGGDYGIIGMSGKWCEAFMFIKYFVSRTFHTISIWLTVTLALQRFVSVSLPFKATSMFSIKRILILIAIVTILSPLLHVYHIQNEKTTQFSECHWKLESECTGGGCVYLWFTMLLMHFIPCILLIGLSVAMVIVMNRATKKMKRSRMITSVHKLHKRDIESRRISFIVIAVVVVFLIPEVPYGLFLMVNVIKYQTSEALLSMKTNRQLICAYEVLVVLTFHANFWIYLAMNRRFRRGLMALFESAIVCACEVVQELGVRYSYQRRYSESSTDTARPPQTESYTQQTALSRSNSNAKDVSLNRRASRASTLGLEMKTYQFDTKQ